MILLLTLVFVIINVIEVWMTIGDKKPRKAGMAMGIMGAVEFLLMIYLFLKKEASVIIIIFIVEAIHWLTVAFSITRTRPKSR